MKKYLTDSGSKGLGRAGFVIGIDVGGTNTDAVLYDSSSASAAACIKIPTRHNDYASSVTDAIGLLLTSGVDKRDLLSINISTTLSTNAILENKGTPVNLVLIGFKRYPHICREILAQIKPASILYAAGGHTVWGERREALDEAAVAEFAAAHRGELFAVSSIYSTRNPEHETRAKELLVKEGCAVTCGHELARSRLNAVKRTITACLNSSLIPLTERLISGIRSAAVKNGLNMPIMFLRSDSSLVSSEWCLRYPIETVFSGPAASVRGGRLLAMDDSAALVIADMGGTSTDIGAVDGGRAVFTDEGAIVGGYRTMIPSLDINTIALGGDSFVRGGADGITVGPHRALPLCRVRGFLPDMSGELDRLLRESEKSRRAPEFIAAAKSVGRLERGIFFADDAVKKLISRGAAEKAARDALAEAVRIGAAVECAFTPTDALNVLGLANSGEAEDSRTAERIFAGMGCQDAARKVRAYVQNKLSSSMDAKAEGLYGALRVCVGAPVAAFAPQSSIGRECLVPGNRSVAGAVGAAASSHELTCIVSIARSFSDESFTAFLPTETIVSKDIDNIIAKTELLLEAHMSEQARQMGCADFDIRFERSFVYLGKEKTPGALSSVVLTGKVLVRNA